MGVADDDVAGFLAVPADDLVEAGGRGFFVPMGVLALAVAGDAVELAVFVASLAVDVPALADGVVVDFFTGKGFFVPMGVLVGLVAESVGLSAFLTALDAVLPGVLAVVEFAGFLGVAGFLAGDGEASPPAVESFLAAGFGVLPAAGAFFVALVAVLDAFPAVAVAELLEAFAAFATFPNAHSH